MTTLLLSDSAHVAVHLGEDLLGDIRDDVELLRGATIDEEPAHGVDVTVNHFREEVPDVDSDRHSPHADRQLQTRPAGS